MGPFGDKSALVQEIARHRTGTQPLLNNDSNNDNDNDNDNDDDDDDDDG